MAQRTRKKFNRVKPRQSELSPSTRYAPVEQPKQGPPAVTVDNIAYSRPGWYGWDGTRWRLLEWATPSATYVSSSKMNHLEQEKRRQENE